MGNQFSDIIDMHGYPSSYSGLKAKEAAILTYREQAGDSPHIALELALTANRRLAYSDAVQYLVEGIHKWPDFDVPYLGIGARLQAIDCAVHANMFSVSNTIISEIKENLDTINSTNCIAASNSARGAGIHSAMPAILEKCLSVMTEGAVGQNALKVLLDEYEETAALAEEVDVISLGSGCYGWLQPNRYMLRRVSHINNMMPFNMSIKTIKSTCIMLEDNFSKNSDPFSYTISSSVQGTPVPKSIPYTFLYNHECDDKYLENNFALLSALNGERAATFKTCGSVGRRIYVLVTNETVDVPRLENALAAHMQDDEYRLLLISTQFGARPDWVQAHPNTRTAYISAPHEGYNWVTDQWTQPGYDFDLAVREVVRKTMQEIAAA